ncbi:MAG: bifunctional 5,10-methylenetetrahydrofolate dehydrogenase/5,10-methenyltetrahydrofolate cyclohydrolase [Candidatus Liptonbacteria bacterium]|nr:bifunctional 5,10-methylenetetrahydrofolate dehydrogenase/5,10-methenyltetrahydrofolate cyclohydrolase [Candidatus Liptonbacteria bacterium]
MDIINGKAIAAEILDGLKSLPKPEKFLAGVLVGDNPASLNFLKQKEKTAKELDVDFRLYTFPTDIKNDDLRAEVRKIAEHKTCGGVVLQLPLPAHLNRHYILNAIPREKDVDVLGERAVGAFFAGRNPVLPPAVGTVEKVCQVSGIKLQDTKVAIVGLGILVGAPIATWIMEKGKEVYLLHKGSGFETLKIADLVISGVGKAGLITPDMLKAEAGVIDFGYSETKTSRTDAGLTRTNAETKKISGDFDAETLSLSHVALSFYTPTPGGTGPILVAKLLENFYKLNY